MVLVGSILLGIGLGLFKKLANSKLMVGPRFLSTFVFFTNLALIMVGPWFKYTYLSHQLRQAPESTYHTDSEYYNNRSMSIVYFFLNAVLASLASFSILNAL